MIPGISRSISRKFFVAVLATTFLTLLAMATAMVLYDVSSYRTAWVNDLTTQADILATVSAPAVAFNDPKAAGENLDQLKARPNILAAVIYSAAGTPFARYAREADAAVPARARPSGYTVDENRISAFREIRSDGDLLGTVFLVAEYPLRARIQSYVTILAAVMLACLLFRRWSRAGCSGPSRNRSRASPRRSAR